MNKLKRLVVFLLFFGVGTCLQAKETIPHRSGANPPTNNTSSTASFRADCSEATAQIDLNINNVRARLLNGGDMWWDFSNGRYVVPNVAAGETQVSSIFAGSVWIGGFDDGGNLKLAAQTYRSEGNDYWPGPLDPLSGSVTEDVCEQWDRHFTVYGDNINATVDQFLAGTLECSDVPDDVLKWPGRGNPHFFNFYGFELPDQPLAPFFDENGDEIYNPCDGDFPIIEVRGCEPSERGKAAIADQMIYWIYNDNGGIHTQTRGDAIRMEIQVLAFGYATNDEVNDMTFYRHKMINRANAAIDSTHFSMWVDPDLGCHTDDFVGCDTSRSMAIIYNEETIDGAGGCAGGTPSYGDEVPILAIDYFRGPLDEFGDEIGMSSFTYYNNQGTGQAAGTLDPDNAVEYYRYMTGSWRDGLPFTAGGTGRGGAEPTRYAFPDPPSSNGWSMCSINTQGRDVRTLQTSGPFRLDPGAINELIIGVAWVPDQQYPCPSLDGILQADNFAQALFDNCFKITDGPDAPDIDIVELDKELIIIMSNDTVSSNNKYLSYAEKDLQAPPNITDSMYVFEGYKVYQLANATVSLSDLEDPDKARLIYQVDLNNGVGSIFNWEDFDDQGQFQEDVFVPTLRVEGADQGIQHTFKVTEDQFAQGERALINHKKYYFIAVAYAYNNYQQYDPSQNIGQRRPYLEGRLNIGSDGLGTPYVGIPRIVAPEFAGVRLNAKYGDGPAITRFDGVGTGSNFLDLGDGVADIILENNSLDEIPYANGAGPINVKIVDPIRVVDGVYNLTIIDEDLSNTQLDDTVRWMLSLEGSTEQWFSELAIDVEVEQVIPERGISLTIGQVEEPSVEIQEEQNNGFIGAAAEYQDGAETWYLGVAPGETPGVGGGLIGVTDYLQTAGLQADADKDPQQIYKTVLEGTWVPYGLCNYRTLDPLSNVAFEPYLSPAWINPTFGGLARSSLENLNNVDIVLTPDQSKWSRCVVVETGNRFHEDEGFTPDGASHFELRSDASIGKDGTPDATGGATGLSYFPGYAIDVETGERLNIFFGENSIYNGNAPINSGIGKDMIWNPTNESWIDFDRDGFVSGLYELILGGQHFVYVTNTAYDGCANLRSQLSGTTPQRLLALRTIQWTSFPILGNVPLTTMAEGLVPSELTFKLRVNNPYKVVNTNDGRTHPNNGYPQYKFELNALASQMQQPEVAESALDLINVVPNPYFAYSLYENTRSENIVKIVNIPAKCTITIYSLDGKFIRQYGRDEVPVRNSGQMEEQIVTSLEWDLKNSKGIPISSGVYLIHVQVPGVGERVIKWFGVNRQFESQDF